MQYYRYSANEQKAIDKIKEAAAVYSVTYLKEAYEILGKELAKKIWDQEIEKVLKNN